MQFEMIELAIFSIILSSLMMLALGHLLDIHTTDGRERKTAVYGSLVFLLLSLYFLANALGLDVNLIVVIYGTALSFLPLWVISMTKPEWLESWKYLFVILFAIMWSSYVLTRLLTTIVLTLYFVTIVFAFSIVVLLVSTPSNKKLLVLVAGLLIFYFDRAFTFVDLILTALLLVAGPLIVLIWYLISKRN